MEVSNGRRVVLITGSLSDIGRATAEILARDGYSIILNYKGHSKQAEDFVIRLINEFNSPNTVAIQADVRFRDQIRVLFDQAYSIFGKIDVLINNAGINKDMPFLEMTDNAWEEVLSTILDGSFMCAQEYAKRYDGNDGNIINIGAITALKGRKNGINYCCARAGVLALTKCLALELAPRIRVNTVTPGRINTTELRNRYKLNEQEDIDNISSDIPLNRLGKPEDIGKMIEYIINTANYVTGQNFIVDGGLFMR